MAYICRGGTREMPMNKQNQKKKKSKKKEGNEPTMKHPHICCTTFTFLADRTIHIYATYNACYLLHHRS